MIIKTKLILKNAFKKRLKRLIGILLLGFLLLFVFRLIYGYTITIDSNQELGLAFDGISGMTSRNYASKEYKSAVSVNIQNPTKIDQKYEKVADISTKSTAFDTEETQTRNKIDEYNALIQFEKKSGNKGNRSLSLLIGVPPENFDKLYEDLIRIGEVQRKEITKKDKTNEYKELNAKKASLEKIRNALIALKSKGGKIEEYMQLENRILEIEQQLQELGVSLGDFDSENEFCTVRFALQEGKEAKISLMHRIKVALEWAIKFYLRAIVIMFFIVLFCYLLLLLIEKLKIIERLTSRSD